jgi:hypothetical protein
MRGICTVFHAGKHNTKNSLIFFKGVTAFFTRRILRKRQFVAHTYSLNRDFLLQKKKWKSKGKIDVSAATKRKKNESKARSPS